MKPRTEIPDDPALPAIAEIKSVGLAAIVPEFEIGAGPVELHLVGYSPGSRATFEAQAGDRRFAIKVYADDPSDEAKLYQAFAGDTEVRVPPLLAWNRDLRLLVIGWLEGPTAHELIKNGEGSRAGELAARWLRHAASLSLRLGPIVSSEQMLEKAREWVATLVHADPWLGGLAKSVAERLEHSKPKDDVPRLVHGTLYDRHIIDTGDGPGLIDWQRFGRGPLEFDAGTFLSMVGRIGLRAPRFAEEVAKTEAALRTGTRGLLDEHALEWYQAIGFLRLGSKPVGLAGDQRLRAKVGSDRRAVAQARALALLREATRRLEVLA